MTDRLRPIELEVELPIRVDAAWRAISEPDEVERWFAAVSPLGALGDAYEVDFGDGSRIDGVLGSVEPGRRFSHSWHWAGDDEAETTQVTWSVEPAGTDRSRVRLRHEGWSEAGLDAERRDDHEGYWQAYLAALEDVIATQEP